MGLLEVLGRNLAGYLSNCKRPGINGQVLGFGVDSFGGRLGLWAFRYLGFFSIYSNYILSMFFLCRLSKVGYSQVNGKKSRVQLSCALMS